MLDQPLAILALVGPDEIPLWLKIVCTLFVCLLVPVNWLQYGPGNFLWFSDIAVLTAALALWFEDPLLASMMALAVVLLEFAWIIDFFVRLVAGAPVFGLSDYMFDPKIPLVIRAISLFHIALPVLLLWMVHQLGYDSRAFVAQTLLAWVVLPLSYLLTKPSENVNRVYGPGVKPQTWMPGPVYVGVLMILFPAIVYLPSHLLLKRIFG